MRVLLYAGVVNAFELIQSSSCSLHCPVTSISSVTARLRGARLNDGSNTAFDFVTYFNEVILKYSCKHHNISILVRTKLTVINSEVIGLIPNLGFAFQRWE
jgi:hypothetical protein